MDLIKDNIPDIRFLHDMKDFVYDEKWFASAPNLEVYYMYRGLAKDENDKKIMAENNLRYDITVIPPQMLGLEFTKTIGHEHALVPNANLTHTEIYEVLEGESYYLLQKHENGKITDIYAVHTKIGEKCIVPPNYGHVAINASDKELIMANWSESNFKSDYSLLQKNRGAGYYALSPAVIASQVKLGETILPNINTQNINWEKNNNYSNVPKLKICDAKDFNYLLEQFGIDPNTPMYDLVNSIDKLDFLKNPQKYEWN